MPLHCLSRWFDPIWWMLSGRNNLRRPNSWRMCSSIKITHPHMWQHQLNLRSAYLDSTRSPTPRIPQTLPPWALPYSHVLKPIWKTWDSRTVKNWSEQHYLLWGNLTVAGATQYSTNEYIVMKNVLRWRKIFWKEVILKNWLNHGIWRCASFHDFRSVRTAAPVMPRCHF